MVFVYMGSLYTMSTFLKLFIVFSTCAITRGQFRSPEITEHPADLLVPRNEPATLNCHAEGRPRPTITWYKNGKPFRLKKEGTRHVLLDNGDLFFLRVLQTKKDEDSGLYWCQATNSVGTVRSKNATLEIAVLKEEFVESPEDARVAEGETALLRCVPPKGHPEPVVVWTKDSVEIDPATQHRFKIVDKGSLVITGVRVSDSGQYLCRARNVYGSRESNTAKLSVLVPPHFVTASEGTNGNAGSTVELVCRVGGDPPPEVFWERAPPGELPIERMSQEENGQVLRIRHATADDQGVYICKAENPVGSVKTNISLSIYSRPMISVNPVEARVGINGSVSFECKASGNPIPTTYWTHEGTGVVVGTGQTWGEGRVFVDSHNTLTIRSITKDDEGFYVCSAVGVAGSALARAQLEVQSVSDMPPPLIALGAPNQTLPVNTEGEMPCEASGTPEPKVVWFVGDKPFEPSERARVTPFGTLRIEKLKMSDTGVYTCKAISEAGTTEWATSLAVAKPTNPNVAFFKMPSDRALPEPPGSVTVQAVNTTSVTLGWRRSRPGSSPILGFILQQWSPDLRGPWTTSITRPASLSTLPVGAIVTGLLPDTRYIFVVRASNSHGLSRPSDITPIVHTLATDKHHTLSLQEIRARIAVPSVRLMDEVSVTATAVRVKWQLLVDASIIEGIYVRYRAIGLQNMHAGALSVETVYFHKTDFAPPEDYLITGLRPNTEYEIFITPFYENVEGQPSAAIRVRTLESQPAVAPVGVTQEFLNETTVVLHWKPIPLHLANGVIQNYFVQVIGSSDDEKVVSTVPGDSNSAVISGLNAGTSYQASVRGLTGSGPGPASDPLPFTYTVEDTLNPVLVGSDLPTVNLGSNQYLVIGIAVASVFIFLFLSAIIFYIFKQRKKNKSPSFFGKGSGKDPWCEYTDSWNESCKSITNTGSASSNHISQTKSNSISHGFTTSTSQPFCNNSQSESFDNTVPYQIRPTEDLYEDPDGLRLVSFTKYSAKRCFSPEPYATTPLIGDNYLKGTIQASRQPDAINCATISPPDLCPNDRFVNFNAASNKGDLLGGPVLQFPPPPSVPEDKYDNSMGYGGKNKNSFTRFLQQQLPYSMTGGSSSGGSQKSHGSPIIRSQRGTRIPNNHFHDYETRLLQPQDLPSLVEDKTSNHHRPDPGYRGDSECYSQPLNIIPDSTNSSVLGDGEESDSYSYSSGCSSNPALTQSHERNFVESLRTADSRWPREGVCNEDFTNSNSFNSQKRVERKPYSHLIDPHLNYESVTSPLV